VYHSGCDWTYNHLVYFNKYEYKEMHVTANVLAAVKHGELLVM
jgi:hypothetical protein